MTSSLKRGLAIAAISITLPVSAVLATAVSASVPAAAGAGLCTELGCRSGPTKCADGTLTTESGTKVDYICYTTLEPT